jgi:uncharacterized membrane protein
MSVILRVLRVLFEIGGLLNDTLNALLGAAILAFGYWANQFWLMCLGAFGIAVGIYRFAAHLSQWRRASKSN